MNYPGGEEVRIGDVARYATENVQCMFEVARIGVERVFADKNGIGYIIGNCALVSRKDARETLPAFQKGDQVRCKVKADGLTYGQIYTVTESSDREVRLLCYIEPSKRFPAHWFERVEKPAAPQQDEETLMWQALQSRSNPDQQRIARKFLELCELCLRKNHDYGSTFATPPCLAPNVSPSAAVLVRMSDKIGRLQTLLGGAQPFVMQESLRDTIRDLSVYGILWEIAVEIENEQESKP